MLINAPSERESGNISRARGSLAHPALSDLKIMFAKGQIEHHLKQAKAWKMTLVYLEIDSLQRAKERNEK